MMRRKDVYLVTGGAGFIGSHLVERLVAASEQVRVLDDLSTGRAENLESCERRIDFREASILDVQAVRSAMEGVRYVLHQAALPSVPRSIRDPWTTNRVNVEGTLNVLQAARDAGVDRVVCASSSSVYGDTPTLPKVETMTPSPRSPYAVSKLAVEHYCQVFFSVYGLEAVALRYFNVFGPRQDPESEYAAVIPRFISALVAGRRPIVYGDGSQSRDFTYVTNVVDANLLAARAPKGAGEAYNIAFGKQTTLNELLALLSEILERAFGPDYRPPREGDVLHSLAEISKAKRDFGYAPHVSLREGLGKTAAWFTESGIQS